MRRAIVALAVLFLVLLAGVCWPRTPGSAGLRVFLAAKIITIDEDRPVAAAVAVEAGRIVAVGSLQEVEEALGDRRFELDSSFAGKVLIAGFVDPHIHPMLAATLLSVDIVSAVEWSTPSGRTRAVRGREGFLRRLRELHDEHGSADWLMVWGYHAPYHGALSKADLDAIANNRPIFVWQRSVHEMYFNSAALEELGLNRKAMDAHPQADWQAGRLWERGAVDLGQPMMRILSSPTRILSGLSKMNTMLHRGGLTTVAEQGFPQVSAAAELAVLRFMMWWEGAPYRFVLVPNAMYYFFESGNADAAQAEAAGLLDWSSERVRIVKHAKYFADGAIYSLLMQMSEPYLDGHHGEWLMTPDEQKSVLDVFWESGWDLHVHVNGDAGLDVVLDQVELQRRSDPGSDRRVVLEHYGYARDDQHQRVKDLGIAVSNNSYYVHELAPVYSEHGLGPERASNISPLGGLARAGVPISFHSDYLMAPAEPLTLVWAAVNRIGSDGEVWGRDQRLGLDLALRAVTLEAAASVGMEGEIGSIEVGKRADFTVLGQDPYAVAPETLRDIEIFATVLDGVVHPLASP